MAYNTEIAEQVEEIVSQWPGIKSKKMFGGIGFLLHGNMICGVHRDFLILRLGAEAAQRALRHSHVRPFDITGRPMKGWVMVERQGLGDRDSFNAWLVQACDFGKTLEAK